MKEEPAMAWMRVSLFFVTTMAALTVGGCGSNATMAPDSPPSTTPAADACSVAGWCTKHGVPEELCAQCNAKVAAELKKKGDWCKEHNRPESQCFLCNPKLADKFAAEYEAKYGKKPPKE
jgi:hypothetical protein